MTPSLMNDHQDTITRYMFLGLLPFFIGAFGPWIFASNESWLSDLFLTYSNIILAFLAGIIWSVGLLNPQTHTQRHLHSAIGFSLIPLLAYFCSPIYSVALLAIGFLILLFWENLFLKDIYPKWYAMLRHKITFIVLACHMLVMWNLIHD